MPDPPLLLFSLPIGIRRMLPLLSSLHRRVTSSETAMPFCQYPGTSCSCYTVSHLDKTITARGKSITLYITQTCGICESGFPVTRVRTDCCHLMISSKAEEDNVADAASPDPRMPRVYMVLQFLDLVTPSSMNDWTPPLLDLQSHDPFRNLPCSLSALAIGSWWLVPMKTPYSSAIGPFLVSSR